MYSVYKLENLLNGKKYIGYAKNYKSRASKHLSDLRNQRHDVFCLQQDFNSLGEDAFSFYVLACALNRKYAKAIEHSLILEYETLNPDFGYNKSTYKGWGLESRFRDSERKFIKKGKYELLEGVSLHHAIPKQLFSNFSPS